MGISVAVTEGILVGDFTGRNVGEFLGNCLGLTLEWTTSGNK